MIHVFQDDGRCLTAWVATITGAELDDVSPPEPECPWERLSRRFSSDADFVFGTRTGAVSTGGT